MKSKWSSYIWEIGKWGLVIYLIFPLATTIRGPVDFGRVILGEALMIILIGKLFYDTVIWKFTRQRKAAGQEMLAMIGMVVAIGFILVMFFLLVGITLLRLLGNRTSPFP